MSSGKAPRQTRMVEEIDGDIYAEASKARVDKRRADHEAKSAPAPSQASDTESGSEQSSVLTSSSSEEEPSTHRPKSTRGESSSAARRQQRRSRSLGGSTVVGKESSEDDREPSPPPPKRPPDPRKPIKRKSLAANAKLTPQARAAQERSKRSSSSASTVLDMEKDDDDDETGYDDRRGGCCCSCGSVCVGCTDWRGWGWLKANSAYFVGFTLAVLMTAIGLTGAVEQWMFCQIGDVKIGAVGYCQGGSCTRAVFYNIETVGSGEIYESTMAGSAVLLLFGLGGIVPLGIFLYTLIGRACNAPIEWQSPHRALYQCCQNDDPESQRRRRTRDESKLEKLEGQAMADNCIEEADWDEYSHLEKERMIAETKAKNAFDWTVHWMLFWALICYVLIMVWVDSADASQDFTYDVVQVGIPCSIVAWFITWKIYRHKNRMLVNDKVGEGIPQAKRHGKGLKENTLALGSSAGERARRAARRRRGGSE